MAALDPLGLIRRRSVIVKFQMQLLMLIDRLPTYQCLGLPVFIRDSSRYGFNIRVASPVIVFQMVVQVGTQTSPVAARPVAARPFFLKRSWAWRWL